MDDGRKEAKPHPRASANCISAATFWWMNRIFLTGYKRELDLDDLFEPLKEHKSARLGDLIEKNWRSEIARCKQKGITNPSLMRVLVKTFGLQVALYGLFLIVYELLIRVSQPLFLGNLLSYFTPGSTMTLEEATWNAVAVAALSGLAVIVYHPYEFAVLHLGMRMRIACCSLMYRKSLLLSPSAMHRTTAGQIVNLMSNDVARFDMAAVYVNQGWIAPLELLLCCFVMWMKMGPSIMVGVTALLLTIPLQLYLGRQTSKFRFKTAIRTDERVRLMNEIISGVQVIKMYAWEHAFSKLVALARRTEIHSIKLASYVRGFNKSFFLYTTRVTVYMSVVAYVLMGNHITAEMVFVMTSYYNIIRHAMTMFFPASISHLAELRISIQRIQKFLLLDEISKEVVTYHGPKGQQIPLLKRTNSLEQLKNNNGTRNSLILGVNKFARDIYGPGVNLDKVTAYWSRDSGDPTLSDVTLNLRPGELVIVIGTVGAGKTSLIQAVLGELPLLSGSRNVNGQLSYVAQEPWLFSGTIRQNVTFGLPWDPVRYKEVVHACALERDLSLMPHGDLTLVGERGVTLSGGQRARVSLARAVYKEANIYLLDDPLSAVDAHVARHLMEDCILGLLRTKCVLLATHQLQFLPYASHIIVLDNGRIEAEGTYYNLKDDLELDLCGSLIEESEADLENEKIVSRHNSLLNVRAIVRQISLRSTASSQPEPEDSEDKQTAAPQVAETRTLGSVSSRVYTQYLKSAGSFLQVFLMFSMFLLAQLAASGTDLWVTYWTNIEESRDLINMTDLYDVTNMTSPTMTSSLSTDTCIWIHTGLIATLLATTLLRTALFVNTSMRCSVKLHDTMFAAISRSTMAFFNNNPAGRILNRFSRDMGCVDELLPHAMMDALQIMLNLLGIIIVVSIVNYWMLIPTLIIAVIFYFLRVVFLSTSRSIKRMEGVTRSPVYTHLAASLQGLATIRAFEAQGILESQFDHHLDFNSSAYYLFISASRSFGYWLDLVCCIYITFVTLNFLVMGQDILGGNVGLAITQSMGLTGMFQWGMRQSAEVENNMTAVERVVEFCDLESEPPLETSTEIPRNWPENGEIIFENLSLSYPPSIDPVLRDVSFKINSCEKVGIVGRTGAGKSSLITALFRLANFTTGRVLIDQIDTSTIGLHKLRGNISIIPQEPVLFSGTFRKNLDPFDEYTDASLWKALEEVELKDVVSELPHGLESRMSEGGGNLSVGQRQLVCLARAVLRNNRILVLDEATANVDQKTDGMIQNTIRSKFAHCTVITIAHRLNTIMDSNRVLVMDAGKVAEFDAPSKLLKKHTSLFSRMARQQTSGLRA